MSVIALSDYETNWAFFMEQCSMFPFVVERSYHFDARPLQQAFIKGIIHFIDGATLHFREFIIISNGIVNKVSYSYHAQDANGSLIFRYDNAPHKPPLGFEEHKHLNNGSIIAAQAPTIQTIFTELLALRHYL